MTTTRTVRRALAAPLAASLLIAAAALMAAACDTVPTGPTLTAVTFAPSIENPSVWRSAQRPTVLNLSGVPDTTVCCCHVTGTLSNNNSTPVYVLLTLDARRPGFGDSDPNGSLGRLAFFAGDLQAGSKRDFDTTTRLTPIPIVSISAGNPVTVVTAVAHGFTTGDVVNITGTTTTPSVNGAKQVSVVSSNSFTMRVFANDSDRVTIGQTTTAGFATPNFQYPGFLQPCNTIDHVTYQLNVTSSGQPLPIG